MKKFVLLFLLIVLLISWKTNHSIEKEIIPFGWPETHYDLRKNPLTEAKIELGRILFYDPILSKDNSISCASCHSPNNAFAHTDHALSHGIYDRIGIRNAPALMNLAWSKSFMWDGAIHHLDVQSLAPISHPDEMDEKIENVVRKLQNDPNYPKYFKQAFNDSIITGEHVLKSLSQFMLTLVSSNARFDSIKRKEAVFTKQEYRGYKLFKKNCASCHQEPFFTNYEFENIGLKIDPSLNDFGRMRITNNKHDSLKFKVPTLRNIEFTAPYMHDGRFKKLQQVLNHYTTEIQAGPTLSPKLKRRVELNSNEKVDLIAFLLTLSDKSFLFNPKFSFPHTNSFK